MRLTIDKKLNVHIHDMEWHETQALIEMIKSANIEERRIFHGLLKQLTETPFDKLEREEER